MSGLADHLGRLLQEMRQRRGDTQAEVAERADLSLKYLGEIERGEANFTVDALARVATALDWDPRRWFNIAPPSISKEAHALLADLTSGRERIRIVINWLEGCRRSEGSEASTSGQINDEQGSR